jgi:hypothetical protein
MVGDFVLLPVANGSEANAHNAGRPENREIARRAKQENDSI